MGLNDQLASKKEAIVRKWFARVVDSYPAETARFLKNKTDPFDNPVGQTTHESLSTLIDLLSADWEPEAVRKALDPVIRIRAIQSFRPAQATRFVFDLRSIVRETIPVDRGTSDEIRRLDDRIDEMVLTAFDIYMQCREKIYDLKTNDMQSRTYKAFVKAGLIKEPGDE